MKDRSDKASERTKRKRGSMSFYPEDWQNFLQAIDEADEAHSKKKIPPQLHTL